MQILLHAFFTAVSQVGLSFLHNWPFLLASILLAAAFKVYLKPEKVSAFLLRYRRAGVVAATVAAVGTPLCSCGTTAILLGMMAGMMPWAPIVAFMVASPLSSPGELFYSAGLFGWPFAVTYFVASIVLGLSAGGIAAGLENRGWFRGQSRLVATVNDDPRKAEPSQPAEICGCGRPVRPVLSLRPAPACCGAPASAVSAPFSAQAGACNCDPQSVASPSTPQMGCECAGRKSSDRLNRVERIQTLGQRFQILAIGKEFALTTRRLLPMFFGFAFIGFFLNNLMPSEWIAAVFGAGKIYSVPLAATLGLPLYINSEASLPLVLGLIQGGMSQGAALAFLLCGSGTSLGAIAGALTIARWRVVALVVGVLWLGGMGLGFAYDGLLMAGLF